MGLTKFNTFFFVFSLIFSKFVKRLNILLTMKIDNVSGGRVIAKDGFCYYEKDNGEIFPLNPKTAAMFLFQDNFQAVYNYFKALSSQEIGNVSFSKLLDDEELQG